MREIYDEEIYDEEIYDEEVEELSDDEQEETTGGAFSTGLHYVGRQRYVCSRGENKVNVFEKCKRWITHPQYITFVMGSHIGTQSSKGVVSRKPGQSGLVRVTLYGTKNYMDLDIVFNV